MSYVGSKLDMASPAPKLGYRGCCWSLLWCWVLWGGGLGGLTLARADRLRY